jgi:hypothetical protein
VLLDRFLVKYWSFFCAFSIGYCIDCLCSNHGFSLPFWYLQAFPTILFIYYHFRTFRVHIMDNTQKNPKPPQKTPETIKAGDEPMCSRKVTSSSLFYSSPVHSSYSIYWPRHTSLQHSYILEDLPYLHSRLSLAKHVYYGFWLPFWYLQAFSTILFIYYHFRTSRVYMFSQR